MSNFFPAAFGGLRTSSAEEVCRDLAVWAFTRSVEERGWKDHTPDLLGNAYDRAGALLLTAALEIERAKGLKV